MDLEEIVRKYLEAANERGMRLASYGSVSYHPEIRENSETGEWMGRVWANMKLEPGMSQSTVMFPLAPEKGFPTKEEAARYILMESVGKSPEEAILEMEAFGV